MNLQFIASVIINKSQLPEPVHEKAHPRASCAYHLGEGFLDYNLGRIFLPEMSQQQQYPGQAFFARIEKLVN
ncbi:MAG TPA: hypothetical protein VN946_20790 [Terriglobales bacterium]|nr:hypothetical protein [Terriglobales bacterium]